MGSRPAISARISTRIDEQPSVYGVACRQKPPRPVGRKRRVDRRRDLSRLRPFALRDRPGDLRGWRNHERNLSVPVALTSAVVEILTQRWDAAVIGVRT